MKIESMRTEPKADDDDVPLQSPERRATGPLSDAPDEGVELGVDAKTLLEQVEAPRDPEGEVDVASEREHVGKKLEQVTKLIEKEKEKEQSLGAVRQTLGVPHQGGETLKKLEEAEKTLKEEQRNIELASEYNDVLDSFSDLSSEEVKHIAETGKTRKGESIRNKYKKEIHSDLAKELARMHGNGGRRVTWRELQELGKVVDEILKKMVKAVKGIFKGTGGGEGSAHAE